MAKQRTIRMTCVGHMPTAGELEAFRLIRDQLEDSYRRSRIKNFCIKVLYGVTLAVILACVFLIIENRKVDPVEAADKTVREELAAQGVYFGDELEVIELDLGQGNVLEIEEVHDVTVAEVPQPQQEVFEVEIASEDEDVIPMEAGIVEEEIETETESLVKEDEDLSGNNYEYATKDNIWYLAHMGFEEVGVFYSTWYVTGKDPEAAERCIKLAMSVGVHRMQLHYMGANTIYDVVHSSGQYSTAALIDRGREIPEIFYEWAEECLVEPLGPQGLVFQAEFVQGDSVYEKIGNEYFCISDRYNNQ